MDITSAALNTLTEHMQYGLDKHGPITDVDSATFRINAVHDKLNATRNSGPADTLLTRYRRRLMQLAGLCLSAEAALTVEPVLGGDTADHLPAEHETAP